jgi:hypothetical protein
MRTLMIPAKSKVLSGLLKRAYQEDLILESMDGERFVLARITDMQSFHVGQSDDFEQEIEVARQNDDLMRFLDTRGAARQSGRGASLAEVRRRLGL